MSIDCNSFIDNIVEICPTIRSIWLIGSRANGSSNINSDWDFIAFGDKSIYQSLVNSTSVHKSCVDFLVVINGDDFRNAWDTKNKPGSEDKSGSLSEWEWSELSATSAEYKGTKWDEEQSRTIVKRLRAIRVWPH